MTQSELGVYAYNAFTPDTFPLAPNLLYGTIYISDSEYRDFNVYKKYNGGEPFESFVARHADMFNQSLRQGNSSIEDYLMLYPRARIAGLEIRRIIIIADYVSPQITNDTDGIWWFRNYDPTASSYWGSAAAVDYGLIHEWGHAFGALPDIYSLNLDYSATSASISSLRQGVGWCKPIAATADDWRELVLPCANAPQLVTQTALPQALLDLPMSWRRYYPGFGWGPIPSGIMGTIGGRDDGLLFDRYNILQIARRIKIGRLHQYLSWIGEMSWAFPPKVGTDIPLQIVYEFDATRYKDLRIDVYQTDYPDIYPSLERTFSKVTPEGARLDMNGQVTLDALFQNPGLPLLSDSYSFQGMYPAARAVLLFKVYDNQNQLVAFTWSDIRLANLAAWMGINRQAIITLPLADMNSSSPDQFAWTYSIRGTGVLSPPIFIPFVKH